MLSTSKISQYKPVNRCIYCGKAGVKLTNEHIVMYGLGGKSVLPNSSCLACGVVTSQIEQFVSRDMWGPFRILSSLPTRNRRISAELAYAVQSPGSIYFRRRRVPIGRHPAWLHFPVLSEPEFFTGTSFASFQTWSRIYNSQELQKWKGKRVYVGAVNLHIFCRFIEKIAHAFACAEIGLDNFQPLLQEAILGAHVNPSVFVGSYSHNLPAEEDILHRQQMVEINSCGVKYQGVRLRLFANFGAPEYVVVGV